MGPKVTNLCPLVSNNTLKWAALSTFFLMGIQWIFITFYMGGDNWHQLVLLSLQSLGEWSPLREAVYFNSKTCLSGSFLGQISTQMLSHYSLMLKDRLHSNIRTCIQHCTGYSSWSYQYIVSLVEQDWNLQGRSAVETLGKALMLPSFCSFTFIYLFFIKLAG